MFEREIVSSLGVRGIAGIPRKLIFRGQKLVSLLLCRICLGRDHLNLYSM